MSRRSRPMDVAIVGMACRFAGASNLNQYWESILAGKATIREVPPSRWDANHFCEPDADVSDRVSGCRGGYLDEPIMVDPVSLGVMPRTLEGGEPEQFLVLDAARAALDDAGYVDGIDDGKRVEVVIGRGNYFNRGNLTRLQHGRVLAQTLSLLKAFHPDWDDRVVEEIRADLKKSLPPFDAATIPGQLTNATASRVSHRLGLTGPSYVVDAASASALVAVNLGVRSLIANQSDLAIVGGVYIEADVDFPMVFSQLGVLSRSGQPRPYGRDADGLVPGEGVGVLVLKRLHEAERNNDRIYAVIKGIGLSSDGKGPGLTSPDARGHYRAIRRAYRRASIDPATVQLIEGHGLGVPAADRAELRALRAAFPPSDRGSTRVLGAASALVGHAMPAAGMAGLIKASLALHHRTLPASPGVDNPHPLLRRDDDRLRLISTSRPWIGHASVPRRAGVNSFGFAGINAHAVLEEHPSSDGDMPGALLRWPDEAILLSAVDREGLLERVRSLASRLRTGIQANLKDLAATLNHEAVAQNYPARLGLVVGSVEELIGRLGWVESRLADPSKESIRDAKGTYYWSQPLGTEGGLAFLFPGEGSQYPGMLSDLCMHFPEVRLPFDQIDRMARTSGAVDPPTRLLFDAGARGDSEPTLWETSTAVHVVLAAQWALFQLLKRLGIRPNALCGHSSGELPALIASGAISDGGELEGRFNALASVFSGLERSGMIPEARMIGVAADRSRVEELLRDAESRVSIAVDNCPHQVVLVGPQHEVESVAHQLRASGIGIEMLPFGRAYHSDAFEPALSPIRDFFHSMEISTPQIPVYSCCLAGRFPHDAEAIRSLAIAQWTRPVEFRRTIEAMHKDGVRVFVDVGGRGNLSAFVEDTLRGKPAFATAANLPRRSGLTQINHLVASLFAHGVTLDPTALYARRRPVPISLDSEPQAAPHLVPLHIGFPEMRLSLDLTDRLRHSSNSQPFCLPELPSQSNHGMDVLSWNEADHAPEEAGRVASKMNEFAMKSHLKTMNAFLEVQRNTLATYFEADSLVTNRDSSDFEPDDHLVDGKGRGQKTGFQILGPAQQDRMPDHGIPSDLMELGSSQSDAHPADDCQEWVEWRTLDANGDPVAEHHTFGGRRVSEVDRELKGLPVLPFTVMAEMLAEAAFNVHGEGVLVGLRDVKARRWIRYEEVPITLEIRVKALPESPTSYHAALFNRGPVGHPLREENVPDVEAMIDFAVDRSSPPLPAHFDLGEHSRPTRFTASSIYGEQWLFHGPALRAVVGIGNASDRGIEGTLRVLPRRALQRDPSASPPLTDPIVLDAFTHLLGCWGLDQLSEGDVIFPLRLGSITVFGDDPDEGLDVDCRIRVKEVERYRVVVDAEILRPDGRVWMALNDWEDWRFYWPPRYRDVFRQPDRELLGESLALSEAPPGTIGVWLQPPADMGKPIWRDVLEQIQLSPEERSDCLRPSGPEERRTLRLWGRIAAKEAVRRLWSIEGQSPVYPADLSILPDAQGRPLLKSRKDPGRYDLPAVSIAHTEGVAVALASRNPLAAVGIDVERVVPRSPSFEELAFTPYERTLLDRLGDDDRPAWLARFWCAKEATGKATGLGMIAGPSSVEVVSVTPDRGQISTRLGNELAEARPDLAEEPFVVSSTLRDEYAYAWVVKEVDPQ